MNVIKANEFLSACKTKKFSKVFVCRKFDELPPNINPLYIIDCDSTYSHILKGMYFNKSGQLLIKTNLGSMPLSCYRDIKVSQTGEFEDYTDTYINGVRLGGGIDGDEERVKLRLLKHIVEKLEDECNVPQQKYSVSTLSNVSVFNSIKTDLCNYAFELKKKFEELHPDKKTLPSVLNPSLILAESKLIDCSAYCGSLAFSITEKTVTDNNSILRVINDIEKNDSIRVVELNQNAYDTLLTWLPVTCNFIDGTDEDITEYLSECDAGLYCLGILKEEK